jgi:hypothetical protein
MAYLCQCQRQCSTNAIYDIVSVFCPYILNLWVRSVRRQFDRLLCCRESEVIHFLRDFRSSFIIEEHFVQIFDVSLCSFCCVFLRNLLKSFVFT